MNMKPTKSYINVAESWCFTLKPSTACFLEPIVNVGWVNDNTQGICPRNISGMMHHNNLTTAASKNTSTIQHQSKLSSLLSSTA